MSDYLVNLSNESPPRSSTVTPIIIDQPESTTAVAPSSTRSTIPSPISPQSALNILTQDLFTEHVKDVAKGLITTIQHRDTIHHLEADALARANEKLKKKVASLKAEVTHYHKDPLCPNNFLPNMGQVTATILIGMGYACLAKWIR